MRRADEKDARMLSVCFRTAKNRKLMDAAQKRNCRNQVPRMPKTPRADLSNNGKKKGRISVSSVGVRSNNQLPTFRYVRESEVENMVSRSMPVSSCRRAAQ